MTQILKNRTEQERRDHLSFFVSLPLKELRHRQDLVKAQNARAFQMYMKAREQNNTHETFRCNRIMDNLDEMDSDLFQAIDQKCFPSPMTGGN